MTPDALAALHAACFDTPRPWQAEEFTRILDDRGVFLIAAPSGFALGRVLVDEAELLTLAVDPGARRRGAGRSLLRRFEAEARDRAAGTAFLEVASGNAPALALYQAAGWATAGRRPGYYRKPDGSRIDAITLRKALAEI